MSTLSNPMPEHIKAKLKDMNGGKKYLEVPYRVVWFREDHPDWGIQTGIRWMNDAGDDVVFGATITNEAGRVIAEGTCRCTLKEFPLGHWEKAETQAVGRALGFAGYGTQFDDTMYDVVGDTKLADAPLPKARGSAPAPAPPAEPTESPLKTALQNLYAAAGRHGITFPATDDKKLAATLKSQWVKDLCKHFGQEVVLNAAGNITNLTAGDVDALRILLNKHGNDAVTLKALPGYEGVKSED